MAALAAFWGATRNGFVWDDPLVLRQLHAINGIGDLIVVPQAIPQVYYRPVVFASYLVDRALGGEQPFWFHFSVVAWHVLNTLLVLVLAKRLFSASRARAPLSLSAGAEGAAAVCAALLFAVHPIHVESVSWMAGRSDVIACGFLLLGAVIYLRAGAAAPWVATGAWLLAVLSKEAVVLAVALFPLLDWATERGIRWQRYVPFAVAASLYVALRQIGVHLIGGVLPPGWESPVNLLAALGFYTGKALLPLRQTVYLNAVPVDASVVLLGALTTAAIAAGFVWARSRGQRVVVVALAWYAILLAPALVLVLRRIATAPVAERYLYCPSVGVALLVAYGFARLAVWSTREGLIAAVVAAVAVAGLIETARRNHVWSDDLQFWAAAAEASPDTLPQRELADAYLRRGDMNAAEHAYQAALQRSGSPEERAMTFANLGNLYRRRNRIDDAVSAFQHAAAVREHPAIYHGLGLALMRKAEVEQDRHDSGAVMQAVIDARKALERALELGATPQAASIYRDWEPGKTHVLLGQVLLTLNERAAAREHFQAALRFEPQGAVGDTARKYLAQIGP